MVQAEGMPQLGYFVAAVLTHYGCAGRIDLQDTVISETEQKP